MNVLQYSTDNFHPAQNSTKYCLAPQPHACLTLCLSGLCMQSPRLHSPVQQITLPCSHVIIQINNSSLHPFFHFSRTTDMKLFSTKLIVIPKTLAAFKFTANVAKQAKTYSTHSCRLKIVFNIFNGRISEAMSFPESKIQYKKLLFFQHFAMCLGQWNRVFLNSMSCNKRVLQVAGYHTVNVSNEYRRSNS